MTRPMAATLHPTCEFNATRDVVFAHEADGFEKVLHVFDANWHGIRSASGCCPGHKLAISNEQPLDGEAYRHAIGLIHHYGIKRVVFQGYSWVANELAITLRREFGEDLQLYAITHVTSAQFENHFEMDMQFAITDGLRKGVLRRAASVKPQFYSVVPDTWEHLIVNFAPNISKNRRSAVVDTRAIFIPVENSWRKNLYTNILAALPVAEIDVIYSVNWPTGLDKMADLGKVKVAPFRSGRDLFAFMGSLGALMNVTLAECQPMTQLEGLAVGTPSLTGALRIEEFKDDPLMPLVEVESLDNPHHIGNALSRLLKMRRDDPSELAQMIDGHLENRHKLAVERYADFLEL
jgi:hypothetical protein